MVLEACRIRGFPHSHAGRNRYLGMRVCLEYEDTSEYTSGVNSQAPVGCYAYDINSDPGTDSNPNKGGKCGSDA